MKTKVFEPDLGGSVDLSDYPKIDFHEFLLRKKIKYMGGKGGNEVDIIKGGKEGNVTPPLSCVNSDIVLSSSFDIEIEKKGDTPPVVASLTTLEHCFSCSLPAVEEFLGKGFCTKKTVRNKLERRKDRIKKRSAQNILSQSNQFEAIPSENS